MKIATDKEMEKRNLAYKIVEFWHISEFLSQESFPKESRENYNKVDYIIKEKQGRNQKHKNKTERKISKFTLYNKLPMENEITELLEKDKLFYEKYPFVSSVMHLCVGKIKREILIKALYRCLHIQDDRPEEDSSSICLIGLKVDNEGVYVKNSLRVSPLVWGIYQCYKYDGKIDGIITNNNYYNDIKVFEEQLNEVEPLEKVKIKQLYEAIYDKYVNPICKDDVEHGLEGSFIYTRYDNEKTFKREDEKVEDVSELVKGFYTDDLELVKENIKNFKDDGTINSDIVDYIVGAYYECYDKEKFINNRKRIDIRDNKEHIERWLSPEKSPYGKWPSKFNPALMQQIAINIGVSEPEGTGKIFSVNGPPGTGKTTLLKEVIAANIVNRAKFLCKYENSDDAFMPQYFEHGNKTNKGYDKFSNKYYAIKDEELTDFSMLVASCNNGAVENITMELPDRKKLLSGLKIGENDSEEFSKGLTEVINLFDIIKNTNKESYKKFIDVDGKKEVEFVEKSDIYFSWLAHKLTSNCNDDEKYDVDINSWGLISAPMGKSSNIGKYSYHVLNEVIESFYSNEMVEKRKKSFQNIKQEFSNQFSKVEGIKKELEKISHLSDKYKKREATNKRLILEHMNEIDRINIEIQNHLDNIEKYAQTSIEIEGQLSEAEKNEKNLAKILKYNELSMESLKNSIEVIKDAIIAKEYSRKWYEIIFVRWIKTQRLSQIEELKERLKETVQSIDESKGEVEESKKNYNEATNERKKFESQLKRNSKDIKNEKSIINTKTKEIIEKNKTIEDIRIDIFNNRKKLEDTLSENSKKMVVIDDKFWENFSSDNEEVSKKIQISNPWITEEYNREREKLFYLALQLHKEFVLSSKACRDNFKNLAMMWRYRENSDGEICLYSKADKEKSYSHLINTLFLLTPVMSTTFASVGRFLGNVREPGSIGLLIVDEAGQASPHVALGALWRCKKAIVVGDPKQVEPVVTDDSDAIKKAFADKVIIPYMRKTSSVQEFADRINNFGSCIKDTINIDIPPTWVGCPLIIHRRCINPMFDISNELSYGRTMKMCTFKAQKEDEDKFVKEKSCWINISGKESGYKNHFIYEQGKIALDIIINSFEKYGKLPNLYVISPFTTVVAGIKEMVRQSDELKKYGEDVEKWIDNNCGTVHKFQGKEAKEVIFLLGCDEKAEGAVRWVKPNIINVAATRAQYRLYVIGDYEVWSKSKIFKITKGILDN